MYSLDLATPTSSSRLLLGEGLLANGKLLERECAKLGAHRTVVVSNPTVMRHLKDRVALPPHQLVLIKDGEQHKNWRTLNHIYDQLLTKACGRDTLMLALGGGVVGDVAGFAAATYQRGITLAQLPTTLLAQVDSSIGGKTAINHPLGKNMIGVFYQPALVVIDPLALSSLPERELTAGLAEVVKYALIRDASFAGWLKEHAPSLLARDASLLLEAIHTSCRHKLEVVERDEREQGERALLNLGHTFGHAIEKHLGYTGWLHGEAVGLGMRLAADVSKAISWLKESERQQAHRLCDAFGFHTKLPPGLDAGKMVRIMLLDKKNRTARIHLVLLKAIGQAEVCAELDTAELTRLLNETLKPYRANH